MQLAFPGARVWFAAEPEHVRWVRSRLHDPDGSFGWVASDIPPRLRTWMGRNGPRGLSAAGRFWSRIRALAASNRAELLVLASITAPGLTAWKASLRADDPPTIIIPHGILALLDAGGALGRWRAALLRVLFRWRAPRTLRYVALGGSIHAALREIDPRVAERFSTLEIPNLWTAEPPAEAASPALASFGYFGVAAKGFAAFERLAARVREAHPDAVFRLIGFHNGDAAVPEAHSDARAPLTSTEYARRAASITHAVWTGEPEHYRLTASASYVDTIAFGKPVVAMRCGFVERYFAELGDIGYLCDSEAAMLETLAAIAGDFPRERYERQRANLAAARSRFDPERLAGEFRRITAEARDARPATASGPFAPPLAPAPGGGVLFVLSGIPIDDGGGGARCTQLALEALRQGEAVVFVNRFPKHETVDLGLRLEHPNLLSGPLSEFNVDRFLAGHPGLLSGRPVGVLVEFGVPDFLPIVRRLRALGAVVVYDLLDDWETSLGMAWYRPRTERAIVQASDALVATSPVLVDRLKRIAHRSVELVPNGADPRLFDPGLDHPPPADLPRADWIALYCGALWGDWMDWDLLIACAERYPSAAFVLVGDYRGQCPRRLPNLHFPGLKPQAELPAYLAHSDVAFLPWKVQAVTQATSPIKVYESLAMKTPVVTPWLSVLEGMPFVLRSRDREHFLRNLEQARAMRPAGPELDRFVAESSWTGRTRRILDLIRAAGAERPAANA